MNLRKLHFVVLIELSVRLLRKPACAKRRCGGNGLKEGTTGEFSDRHIERVMPIGCFTVVMLPACA
jgi:hypothetical protein